MRRAIGASVLVSVAMVAAGVMYAAESEMPDWAYAIPTEPAPERPPEDGTLLRLPGSDLAFTRSTIRGRSDTDENVLRSISSIR